VPYLRGVPVKALENEKVEYEAEMEKGKIKLIAHVRDTFEMSKGDLHADMCEMNILNEPEILRNLIERYKKDDIFTYIGPTLIVVNPYKLIERHFNNRVLTEIRDAVLAGNLKGAPHIFLIAGRAYQGLICGEGKQAIVISGESGAGKTESTKYCMKIITSLSQK
jgi:myosin heavy subunit